MRCATFCARRVTKSLAAQHRTRRDALRERRFDLLLSDLNMPQMDGITLTMQALTIDPDLVSVLMTGQGTIPTAVEAMRVGALDYLLKPFRIASIRPVLARALEVRRLRVRNRQLQDDVARRNSQLEAANRELDAFAARIAHDLRGPVLSMLRLRSVLCEPPVQPVPAPAPGGPVRGQRHRLGQRQAHRRAAWWLGCCRVAARSGRDVPDHAPGLNDVAGR